MCREQQGAKIGQLENPVWAAAASRQADSTVPAPATSPFPPYPSYQIEVVNKLSTHKNHTLLIISNRWCIYAYDMCFVQQKIGPKCSLCIDFIIKCNAYRT